MASGDEDGQVLLYPIKASSNRDALHALQWRRAAIFFEKAFFLFLKVGSECQRKRTKPSNRNLCVSLLIMLLAMQEGEEVSW